jgi:predicted MFS family arabinose efflux permease
LQLPSTADAIGVTPLPSPPAVPAPSDAALAGSRNALLFGNFAIGCGVMVVPGSLNDITRDLGVSVALGGQLISAGAAMLCFGAPVLAALLARIDRRRLLALSLICYGLGHAACALMPGYGSLLPMRMLALLAAAVYTPQAAAAMGVMAPPLERGRAITYIFLGWSLASVLGMPMHSYIGETWGWRWAFALVALLSVGAAGWVWRSLPDGVRPPVLSLASWRRVFTEPVLMAIVVVTALASAGQFTVFSYLAPYYRGVLGADAGTISFLFLWYGAFGVFGNVMLSRHIDHFGAARAVAWLLVAIGLSLAVFALPTTVAGMALALVPWGLGCFACNSAQQARLGQVAPALAPALMALNSSALYLGQAVGAASGGVMLAAAGFDALHLAGLAWLGLALALSLWAARHISGVQAHG